MHICHFAGVINCPYNRNFILDFEMEKSVITCQFYLNHLLTPLASCSLAISSSFYLTLAADWLVRSNPLTEELLFQHPNDETPNVKTLISSKTCTLKTETGCQNQAEQFLAGANAPKSNFQPSLWNENENPTIFSRSYNVYSSHPVFPCSFAYSTSPDCTPYAQNTKAVK